MPAIADISASTLSGDTTPASLRVLFLEDDPTLGLATQVHLTRYGYDVTLLSDAPSADRAMSDRLYDVVLLDLMLPGRSGIDWLRSLRARRVLTPVIAVTAMSLVGDRIAGLNAGADDYITKPFDIGELVARIEAVARRMKHQGTLLLTVGDLSFDLARRTAFRGGREVRLRPKEADLLELLLRNPNTILSRDEILRRVWGVSFDPQTNIVDVYLSYLRSSIDEPFPEKLIMTIRGKGYMLKSPSGS